MSEYDVEINNVFSLEAINFMRKSIVDSYGNEVYFGINFNSFGILDYIEVMARGNKDSVPAIISLSLEFDAVIHNHPSGQLTPSRADLAIASELGNNAGVGFYIVNNDVDDFYEVVRPIRKENVKNIDAPDALFMFTENGLLSKILKKYEYRQEQTELVEATIEAFNTNKHLISEAGTGIGKSFAYLIPALLWLKENKTRIVVSTNTINLQEQIINKDLPSIIDAIAPNVKYALVKGRNNYVCIKKVKDALNDTDKLDFEDFRIGVDDGGNSPVIHPFLIPQNMVDSNLTFPIGRVGQLREPCDISGCIHVRMGGLHIFVHPDAPAVRLNGKAFQT